MVAATIPLLLLDRLPSVTTKAKSPEYVSLNPLRTAVTTSFTRCLKRSGGASVLIDEDLESVLGIVNTGTAGGAAAAATAREEGERRKIRAEPIRSRWVGESEE